MSIMLHRLFSVHVSAQPVHRLQDLPGIGHLGINYARLGYPFVAAYLHAGQVEAKSLAQEEAGTLKEVIGHLIPCLPNHSPKHCTHLMRGPLDMNR